MAKVKNFISEEELDTVFDAVGTAYVMRYKGAGGVRYSIIAAPEEYEEQAIRALTSGHIDKRDFEAEVIIWNGVKERHLESLLTRAKKLGYNIKKLY